MFDKLYEVYVNFRTIRATYQVGFFIYWAQWAKEGLEAMPSEVTWLVFGWLPAVFWPIQLISSQKLPPLLLEFWSYTLPITLGTFSLSVPLGTLVIILFFGILFWTDIKARLKILKIKNGEEAKQSPVAGTAG